MSFMCHIRPSGRFHSAQIDALRPHLKHVWHLDETGTANRVDAVGSITLTHISSPANVAGVYGKGQDFDGTADGLGADSSPFTNVAANSWLISLWIKYDNRTTTGYPFAVMDAGIGVGVIMAQAGADRTYWAGVDKTVGETRVFDDTTSSGTDTWYHFAVARTGTSVRVYSQGVYRGAMTMTTYWAPQNIYVGCRNYGAGPSNFFDGKVDEIYLWEGMTWTGTAQIDAIAAQLYRGGQGSFYR